MMVRIAIFVVFTAAFANQRSLAEDVSDADIEKLVAQLVSPSQPPKEGHPPEDRKADKTVHEAWRKLRQLAPRSFPFVFDHLNDKRYAMTDDAGDYLKNYSVGFLCRDILVSNLQPDVWGHKPFGTAFRRRPNQPDYVGHFGLVEPESAKKWWQARKDHSLRDLQIELLEWVLKEEERLTDDYADKDRELVRKELAELKASEQPRKPSFPFAK